MEYKTVLKRNNMTFGYVLKVDEKLDNHLDILLNSGFTSFNLFFWEKSEHSNWEKCLCNAASKIHNNGGCISALSVYGNPLGNTEINCETRNLFLSLPVAAKRIQCPLISGFAGRVIGRSVPDSLESLKKKFSPVVSQCEKLDIRLAFENCRMGDTWKTGKWNIAINPDAWALIIEALDSKRVGLEWEPCHQLEAFVDVYAQIAMWKDRIFHLHGKDARIQKEQIAISGIYGSQKWVRCCLPGEGDCDWTKVLSHFHDSDIALDIEYEPSAKQHEFSLEGLQRSAKSLAYVRHAANTCH